MAKITEAMAAANVWERVGGREGGTVSALAASPGPSRERIVWAGTMSGVFLSRDSGRTWEISNVGLTSPYVQAVAASPNFARDRQVFSAAVNAGAFRSFTAGKVCFSKNRVPVTEAPRD